MLQTARHLLKNIFRNLSEKTMSKISTLFGAKFTARMMPAVMGRHFGSYRFSKAPSISQAGALLHGGGETTSSPLFLTGYCIVEIPVNGQPQPLLPMFSCRPITINTVYVSSTHQKTILRYVRTPSAVLNHHTRPRPTVKIATYNKSPS